MLEFKRSRTLIERLSNVNSMKAETKLGGSMEKQKGSMEKHGHSLEEQNEIIKK